MSKEPEPTYEVRSGKNIQRTPISPKEDQKDPFTYASYELFAVYPDGTEVFICSFFGGCSVMAADLIKDHFEKVKS